MFRALIIAMALLLTLSCGMIQACADCWVVDDYNCRYIDNTKTCDETDCDEDYEGDYFCPPDTYARRIDDVDVPIPGTGWGRTGYQWDGTFTTCGEWFPCETEEACEPGANGGTPKCGVEFGGQVQPIEVPNTELIGGWCV